MINTRFCCTRASCVRTHTKARVAERCSARTFVSVHAGHLRRGRRNTFAAADAPSGYNQSSARQGEARCDAWCGENGEGRCVLRARTHAHRGSAVYLVLKHADADGIGRAADITVAGHLG